MRPAVLAIVAARSRLLLTAGGLAVLAALLTADVLTGGPLRDVDQEVNAWELDRRWPDLLPAARALVVLGQRGPVAVAVALVVAYVVWRTRSWRPLVLPALAVALLNGVVGMLKIAIGRTAPYDGRDELFAGGTLYPSGHSANSVLMWGALAVVLVSSGMVRRRWPLVVAIASVSVVVGVASIFQDTHWVTDVLAGWLVGGALLAVLTAAAPLWTAPGRPAPGSELRRPVALGVRGPTTVPLRRAATWGSSAGVRAADPPPAHGVAAVQAVATGPEVRSGAGVRSGAEVRGVPATSRS